jgi:hypothetical protein
MLFFLFIRSLRLTRTQVLSIGGKPHLLSFEVKVSLTPLEKLLHNFTTMPPVVFVSNIFRSLEKSFRHQTFAESQLANLNDTLPDHYFRDITAALPFCQCLLDKIPALNESNSLTYNDEGQSNDIPLGKFS